MGDGGGLWNLLQRLIMDIKKSHYLLTQYSLHHRSMKNQAPSQILWSSGAMKYARMIEEYNIEKSSKSEEKVVRHWQSKPSPWRLHYKKNERKIPARTNCRQQEVVTRASNRGTVGGAPISSHNSQLRMTERRNLTSLAFSKDQSWDFSPSFFMNMDSQLVRRTDRRGF